MRSSIALFVASAAALPAQAFQLETQAPPVATLFGKLALGDVNGDGHPDLANVGWFHAQILPGTATGVFGAPIPLPAPFVGNSVRLVDSNGDGQLDVWFCDQNGTARVESGSAGMAVTAYLGLARSVACADFDEDGHVDLVLGRDSGPTFARNDATGSYPTEVALGGSAGMGYIGCEAADLNGDGHLDFVVRSFGLPSRTWLGDGAGHFTAQGALPLAGAYYVGAIADVDGDQDLDLICCHATFDAVICINNGAGVFVASSPLTGFAADEVVAADFDGDGILDLVGADGTQLQLLLGTGGGGFAPAMSWAVTGAMGLVAGDIDGDGRIEAIVTENYLTLAILRNASSPPVGQKAFGPGTPACGGVIGMGATVEPQVGAANFRVTCTNVPPGAHGIVAMGDAVSGYPDPTFGLRVYLTAAAPLLTLTSDAGGAASFALPIPSLPQLVGLTATLQSFWLPPPTAGNTCSPALFHLASSRGLTLTIQR